MSVTGCNSVTKYVVLVINLLIFILGIAIVGLACAAYLKEDIKNKYAGELDDVTDDSTSEELWKAVGANKVLIGAMVLGAVVAIIGCMGCGGAITENSCILTVYIAVLMVFIVACLAVVIVFFASKSTVKKGLLKSFEALYKTAEEQGAESNACKLYQALAKLQNENSSLACCGLNKTAEKVAIGDHCKLECSAIAQEHGNCPDTMFALLEENKRIVGIVMGVLLGIQIIGAVLGICLCRAVRSESMNDGVYY